MRTLIFVMVLLFAFGCMASVLAQGETKPAQPVKTAPVEKALVREGEVVSVDTTTNMLTLKHHKAGPTETFKLDPKAVVKKAGKNITLNELVAGEKIKVVYKKVSGEKVATKITVRIVEKKKEPEVKKTETEPKTK